VLYSDPTLRPSQDVLKRGEGGPYLLWGSGISGDLPIVLVRIDEAEDLKIVRELVRAHEYWRMKRFDVDLVILNERPPSYDQDLQKTLEALVRANRTRPYSDAEGARGNVFVLRADQVPLEARRLLQTVARAVLLSRRGTLSEQVKRLEMLAPAAAPPPRRSPAIRQSEAARALPALEFFNGLGGFAAEHTGIQIAFGAPIPFTLDVAKIPTLKPAFKKDGTVTAASSSGISDGASALVLARESFAASQDRKPLARILGYTSFACEPEWFTLAPVGAMQKLLKRLDWQAQDADLYEINEAFAVVTMTAMKELKLDHGKVNLHGGACALGHPIGATGSRILTTLIHALRAQGKKRGVASLCIGGGEATAIAVEVL